MKRFLIVFSLFLITLSLSAQEWETSVEKAKARAAQEGKSILLVFSGSDWCIPCIKLEKTIWESVEFKGYAADHFVLLRADFPKKKSNALSKAQQEANDHLAERYNKEGLFPLVLLLNKQGEVLGTTGYKNSSPSEYLALLHTFEKSNR